MASDPVDGEVGVKRRMIAWRWRLGSSATASRTAMASAETGVRWVRLNCEAVGRPSFGLSAAETEFREVERHPKEPRFGMVHGRDLAPACEHPHERFLSEVSAATSAPSDSPQGATSLGRDRAELVGLEGKLLWGTRTHRQ